MKVRLCIRSQEAHDSICRLIYTHFQSSFHLPCSMLDVLSPWLFWFYFWLFLVLFFMYVSQRRKWEKAGHLFSSIGEEKGGILLFLIYTFSLSCIPGFLNFGVFLEFCSISWLALVGFYLHRYLASSSLSLSPLLFLLHLRIPPPHDHIIIIQAMPQTAYTSLQHRCITQ